MITIFTTMKRFPGWSSTEVLGEAMELEKLQVVVTAQNLFDHLKE